MTDRLLNAAWQTIGFVFCASLAAQASAGGPSILPLPGGGLLRVAQGNLIEQKFKSVVRQQHDLSCGAAALATLLTAFYDDPTSEAEIIESIFDDGDEEAIRAMGFSLLELKRFAERAGYESAGYRVSDPERLRHLSIPTIGLTNVRGYQHFVVIKGVRGNTVYIADPAFGNRVVDVDDFVREWNGVLLAVVGDIPKQPSTLRFDPPRLAKARETLHFLDRGRTPAPPQPGEFR